MTVGPTFMDTLRPLHGDDKIAYRLSLAFRDWRGQNPDVAVVRSLVSAARDIGANPAHLVAVVAHESRFNPRAQYGDITGTKPFNPRAAQGLIQFIPSTAASLGTTPQMIRAMSGVQQAQLVAEYMRRATRGQPADSLAKVALAVFYPRYVGLPTSTPFPSEVRAANPGIATPADYIARVYGKLPMAALEAVGRGEDVVVPVVAAAKKVAPSVRRTVAAAKTAAISGGIALTFAALLIYSAVRSR